MKKLLTFLTLLTLFTLTAGAETESFDFSFDVIGADGWTTSYADHTVEGTAFNVYLSSYNKMQSGSTITGIPVSKGGDITVEQKDATKPYTITGVYIKLRQWGSKAQTVSLKVSDDGSNWSNTDFSSNNFELTATGLSTKAVRFKFSSQQNQVGLESLTITYTAGSSTPTAVAPTFSPAAGTYYEPVNVTLSTTTPNATIRYTLDGNDPTATTGTVYNTPIAVSETTTIKAIATADGMDPSSVLSATYTIFEPETVTLPYEQSLISGFGKFYYVDKTNPTTSAIWKSNSYGAVASGQISGTKYNTESWLYTPYIDLTNASNPELSFSHAGNYFTDAAAMQEDVQVMVRQLNGTTWSDWSALTINTWPDGSSWDFADNTTSLSTYAGKTIQIAFKYTSSTNRAGSWEIKNFKVQNTNPSAPKYYLVGSFNGWTAGDEDYQFEESNGTYTLDNVNFPDANTTFKIVTPNGNDWTWYGGRGDVDYVLHHRHHTDILMDGGQNYKIQSAGTTSFSFTLDNNTPTNLNVNRTATLAIKGDFTDNWTEVPMSSTVDGWTTTQTVAVNNEFGFVDEFGQYIGIVWTVNTEHLGTNIPMTTDGGQTAGNYKMGIDGTYKFTANNDLTTLVITAISGDTYTLVTNVSELDETSDFIIVSKDYGYAMSTEQRSANRGATQITLTNDDNEAIASDDTQVFKLEQGNDGWYFNTGSGYIYASSSKSNELKTQTNKTDDAKAEITITDGVTSIIFQGTNTHNDIRFNNSNSPKIFSCYVSTSNMNHVSLYKKASTTPSDKVATPAINPGSADSSSPYIVYGGKQEITINCATDGATVYYTTDGNEPTTSSTPYSAPFNLTSTGGNMTVKAIAVKEGLENSAVATAYYRFTNPAAPTFDPASGTTRPEAFDVTISSEYDDAEIYYMLDPASAPTAAIMSTNGTLYENPVNVSGEGSHTLYAMVVRNGIKSDVANATYTIDPGTQPVVGDGDYVKVTKTADLTSGEYLIVYEEGSVAFNGALEGSELNTSPNYIDVVINDNTITSTTTVDDAIFTYDASAGTFKSASGYYIGRTSNNNGMEFGTETGYTHTVSIDNSENAVIVSSGGPSLRYNTSWGFRYYKNNGQSAIALYKKVVEEPATEITLAGLVQLGAEADGNKYCINEDLLGVKKSADGKTIWFKDDNKFADPDEPQSSDNNFEMSANGKVWHSKDASFDQSNWIEVVFPEAVNYDENYAKNLTGTYSYNGGNPKLTVTTTVGIEETMYEGTISTNSYMPANFAGTQQGHYTNNGTVVTCNYFFVTPKPQEVAKIFYAVYSNGKLTMPSNNNGISGEVTVDMSKNATTFEPENDKVYSNFDVIICIDASSAPAPAPQGAPMLKAQGDNYKVYPVNLTAENDVTTAISTVGVNGEVKSVKYVSVAGVVSDRPFHGVNIVVTEYSDGSRTTAKVVK